jgi:TolB-like protein
LKNISRIKKWGLALLVLGFLFLSSQALQAEEKKTEPPRAGAKTRIVVIPFQSVMPEDGSSSVRCPVCGSISPGGSVVKGAEKVLEEIFTDKLRELNDVEIIPSEKTEKIYHQVRVDFEKQSPIGKALKVGNELHADVLAVGYVYRYRERVGYAYSTEHPASVSFEIHLISVKDGTTLWRGAFDKTQRSLTENVYEVFSFVKGGARWVTARQLTKLGVDEVFRTFSGFGQP